MTDTDSEMMLRQQNLDTPQTVDAGGKPGAADLDAVDGADRVRAGAEPLDPGTSAKASQDAVLFQNTRNLGATPRGAAPMGMRGRLGGLVRRGRSLLGN